MNIHKIYGLFLPHFRKRRSLLFHKLHPTTKETRILDVGGRHEFWSYMNCISRITCVNLEVPQIDLEQQEQICYVKGDGRYLSFPDQSFDIVFSNSVIEHLGTYEDQKKFASEIRRVGKSYWVQTPNRWFFVEPHLITPLIHYLPVKIQKLIIRRFSIWGLVTKPSKIQIEEFINSIRLLTFKEMKELFPDGRIYKDSFLFITKSFIAHK